VKPLTEAPGFVLDNSIVCGWFLANQASDYGDAVGAQLKRVDAHAPVLLQLEFTNVLRTACRRGSLTIVTAHAIVDQVSQLPIRIDTTTVKPAELLSLALRFGLTSYDAAYLELALRLQLPIATRDAELAEAAWASGVGVLQPADQLPCKP
jgi:predicted nucleic acid-binding protein